MVEKEIQSLVCLAGVWQKPQSGQVHRWANQLSQEEALGELGPWSHSGWSPKSSSVLTARSLEPATDSVPPALSAPPLLMLCLSVSLSLSLFKFK